MALSSKQIVDDTTFDFDTATSKVQKPLTVFPFSRTRVSASRVSPSILVSGIIHPHTILSSDRLDLVDHH